MQEPPQHFQNLQKRYKPVLDALGQVGQAVREAGPIQEKQAQLIQLAASAAIRSEGAVHSHTRRAMQAGASPEEIRQTLLLLISTIGYPTVAAALSWAEDILQEN
ncbi:MAG: carboxymuconolactone decarboxylase family protein [Desulfohalobiaceae bacterium]